MTTHEIKIVFESSNGADSLTCDSSTWDVQMGDKLTFSSDSGPVRILMLPADQFSAGEFREGDPPIEVAAEKGFTICCGVQVMGRIVGYPVHRDFGKDVRQPGGGDDIVTE